MVERVKVVVDTVDELSRRFTELLQSTVQNAVQRRARLALAGGSVAERFLPRLSVVSGLSEHLEIFWCDERAVPLSDPLSNFRLARELWFEPAHFPPDQLFPLRPADDLEQAAVHYEQLLRSAADPPLDLVLLGVGPDGHIASLFPGDATLSSERWVEPVYGAPKPPPHRLTMTLTLLAQAPRVVVAAFGRSKAEVIAQALLPHSELPLALLLRRARHTELYLDHEAASALT